MGVVRKREYKNGITSWEIDYRDAAGDRVREVVKAAQNKKDAERVLAERMRQVYARIHHLPSTTPAPFDTFARVWLATHEKRVKPSTAESYEDVIECHLAPHFGSIRLSAIDESVIEKYLKAKIDENRLSPTSINYTLAILKMILGAARKRRLIAEDPASGVEKVANRSEEVEQVEFYTVEEVRRLLDAFDPRHGPIYLTGVMTGLRRGELLGVMWPDIDLANNKIHVRRQLVRVRSGDGYRLTLQTPKSQRNRSNRSGYRTVDMPPIVKQALLVLPSRFQGRLVFCTQEGTPIDPDNLTKRYFARAVRKAAVRLINWHAATRHTYAAFQIAQGAHPKYLQVQLGHADISTTLNTYGHLMPSAFASHAARLQEAVFGQLSLVTFRSLNSDSVPENSAGSKAETIVPTAF